MTQGNSVQKRVERTVRSLDIIDLALLLVTENSWEDYEDDLVSKFRNQDIPFIIIHNKSDLVSQQMGSAGGSSKKRSNTFRIFCYG